MENEGTITGNPEHDAMNRYAILHVSGVPMALTHAFRDAER